MEVFLYPVEIAYECLLSVINLSVINLPVINQVAQT
jgi:hypothetical protein